jgi:hypothetical protein
MTVRFGRFSPKKSKSSAKVVAKVKLSQEARSRLLYHFMQFPQLVPFPLVPFSIIFHAVSFLPTNIHEQGSGSRTSRRKKTGVRENLAKVFRFGEEWPFQDKVYSLLKAHVSLHVYIYNYIHTY